ncbi:MAG: antitoxin VapB family protein [Candidatus Baldrarchaeia archaeon]
MTCAITIADDVYNMLRRPKLPSESFSDVIRRLIKSRPKIADIAKMNILSREEAEKLRNF